MSAITREQGDLVYEKICEIKNQTVKDIKQKARELNKAVAQTEIPSYLPKVTQNLNPKFIKNTNKHHTLILLKCFFSPIEFIFSLMVV